MRGDVEFAVVQYNTDLIHFKNDYRKLLRNFDWT